MPMLMDPQMLGPSQMMGGGGQSNISPLARAMMSQPMAPQNYNGANPLSGMNLQQIFDMKSKMQQQTQQPSPSQGQVSQFFNGTNTADPYSGLPSNDGNGMWSRIAAMFQGMGK